MYRPDTPAHLAGKAAHRLPCLSRRVIAEIRRQMKVYNVESAVVSDEDLAQSVTSNLRTLIDALCMPDEVDLSQARATGRRRAQQGIPLAEVQRAFRIGFGALWDLLLDIEYERRTLADVATTFWCLFDQCLEAVGVAYREATAELVRTQRRRRETLLEVLFAGGVGYRQREVGHHRVLRPAARRDVRGGRGGDLRTRRAAGRRAGAGRGTDALCVAAHSCVRTRDCLDRNA
jgi:hypothetical protein